MTLSVLHISDLHRDPANPIGNQVLIDSLQRDRDRYSTKEEPNISPPNLIIVSGDIVQGVMHGTQDAEAKLQHQYDEAHAFLTDLADQFVGGNKSRVIIVPGNHDVSDFHFRESITPVQMPEASYKSLYAEFLKPNSPFRWSWEDFAMYKIADWNKYNQRFAAFCNFYRNFYDGLRSYSIDPAQQVDTFEFSEQGIVIAGFSSCYNNDLLNRQGAIHPDCIAEVGARIRKIKLPYKPLRIAVWHHNTQGPPIQTDYMDPDVVQNFIDGGFSLGFHGHQHKPQYLDTRFQHGVDRQITVISAGTLCGTAAFRFGRAYNIVEIDVENLIGARLFIRADRHSSDYLGNSQGNQIGLAILA